MAADGIHLCIHLIHMEKSLIQSQLLFGEYEAIHAKKKKKKKNDSADLSAFSARGIQITAHSVDLCRWEREIVLTKAAVCAIILMKM